MDLPDAVIDDAVIPIAGPQYSIRGQTAPAARVRNEDQIRIGVIEIVAGDDRAGVARLESERVARAGEFVSRPGVGLEDQLIALGLVPAEVQVTVPAVRSVIPVVPSDRI